ncbi:MAG: DUF364 domain-containing protein, partial [Nitrospirales bacterium]|nr:DUF364 domain-containing protein [Nitrospirales bacterium]
LFFGEELDALTVERFVLGLFFTGVKLSNGFGGICYTPVKDIPEAVCCPSSAKAMPASGQMRGKKVSDLLAEMFFGSAIRKAIGIAVMNALAAAYWSGMPPASYSLQTGKDALDDMFLLEDDHVVLVGAIAPYIRMLRKRGKPFCILEQDPAVLRPEEMEFYSPAHRASEKVPLADVLVVSGTTLINDTLDSLLAMTKPGAKTVVVGPTASILPDALFQRGVHRLGGVLVTDPDRLLDVLAEGGSGYHFFGKSAEKIVLERNTPWEGVL